MLAESGAITVDVDATIQSFLGAGTTSLILNGTSLSATAGDIEVDGGIALTGATVSTINYLVLYGSSTSSSSTVNANGMLLDDGTLSADSGTVINSNYNIIGISSTFAMNLGSTVWNVTGGIIELGENTGSSGQLTLTAGTTVNLNGAAGSSSLFVGGLGQGVLTLQDGAAIKTSGQAAFLQIGYGIASAGNGQMSILSGSTVSVGQVLLGDGFPGTVATLTIDGEGSQLSLVAPSAEFGIIGGTVTVSNGATVTGGSLLLDQGQITLESEGKWSASGPAGSTEDLVVGAFLAPEPGVLPGSTGVASLSLSGGATGSNEMSAWIGANAGANGTMSISGEDSAWSSASSFIVGVGGTGTLNLQEGGVLSSAPDGTGVSGYVGQLAGSLGTVLIDGDDSAWNQTGALHVGDAGNGTLTVQNSGALTTGTDGSTADLSGVIGVQASGQGTVTVTGDDSKWEAEGAIQVGAAGIGTLNITDEAEVSAGSMSVGALAGGQGTVAMTGGTLTIVGNLVIGDAGRGTLTVVPSAPDDEGDISSMNGTVGAQLGSSGQVTIGSALGEGIGQTSSQWTIAQQLVVGEAGSGLITLGGTLTDLSADLGQTSTGNGTLLVENGGMWTTTNNVTIGDAGLGNLTIDTGGFANVSVGAVTLGNQLGSNGTVDIKGQWNMTQALTVGNDGTGTLTIEGGGAVGSGNSVIAQGALSTGTVTVTGSGTSGASTWAADGTLYVGAGGTGTLTVSSGGVVQSRDGLVGQASGSVGTATITGSGSLWSVTVAGGTGTLTVGGNGSEGTLNVQNQGKVIATSVVVNGGGTLNGQGGTITANIVNSGGTITPGDATGTLAVTGNYTQNSGTTLFEIDGSGPGQFDQLNVSGSVALNGGVLDVSFGNGFEPTLGQSFALISALGLTSSIGVEVSGLPSGFIFADDLTATGLDLVTEQTPVPLPSSIWLIASGLILSVLFARRAPKPALGSGSDRIMRKRPATVLLMRSAVCG